MEHTASFVDELDLAERIEDAKVAGFPNFPIAQPEFFDKVKMKTAMECPLLMALTER